MIYITGDTHGNYYELIQRIEPLDLTESDTLIVCGDFGFVWTQPYVKIILSRLNNLPFTIAFIDGNHEDFDLLYTYPVEKWNGGLVHRIEESIYHLMRGQRFEIEGKSFFTMGGAYSIDKAMRHEGTSWWKEELPNSEEYKTAWETLDNCGYEVDYVLTHTVPQSAVDELNCSVDTHDAELTGYFEWLYGELKFKKWYAGHFHVNKLVKDNIQILYDKVEKLT